MFEPKLSWNSLNDNLIEEFYQPALKNAVLYQRKAGYFSSTSFVGITREIIELIEKKGRIQLITSPNFSSYDKKIFEKSIEEKEKIISELFLEDLRNDPDETKQNFAKLMAYMLVNYIEGHPQLEIKIALTENGTGIFHEKLGIIYYSKNDLISFSGSVNETISGWTKNIENFKVFCSWKDETNRQAIEDDKKSFSDIWNEKESNIRIFDLPTAIKEHLLKISPKSDQEFQETLEKVRQSIGHRKEKQGISEETGLRDYQIKARDNWIENNCRGLFSMATGTGKTFTALGCVEQYQKLENRTITIIACPQTHLVDQWQREVSKFNLQVPENNKISLEREIVCYSENHTWRNDFEKIMNDFNEKLFNGKYLVQHIIVFVTHKTLNSNDFKKFILKISDAKKLLIIDEVHNIGSESSQSALLSEYDGRLGLSATPIRHYDAHGTSMLKNYFNGIVFELSLKKAVEKEYLCNYEYHPFYAELNSDEMDIYNELTKKIAAKYSSKKSEQDNKDEYDNDSEIKRANLIANAQDKLSVLQKIINSIFNIKQTLIYCTSNPSPSLPYGSPTQLDNVKELLLKNQIVGTSITFKNPTKDRTMILEKLAQGHYDCITAVRCLDEGVDIPSVETAIIMSSSGNPKQYIQRRGRVLRQSEKTGKTKAIIYDVLVKPPPLSAMNSSILLRERKLVARELLRHKEFASIALNKQSANDKIKNVAEMYKINIELLDYEYIENME